MSRLELQNGYTVLNFEDSNREIINLKKRIIPNTNTFSLYDILKSLYIKLIYKPTKEFPLIPKKNELMNMNDNMENENEKEEINLINKTQFISFKMIISSILIFIYIFLFFLYIPKKPVIVGPEQKISELIRLNTDKSLNILINSFDAFLNQVVFYNNNKNSKISYGKNLDLKGNFLQFQIDKKFILRWLIGFLYFIIRNLCFIYSSKKFNGNLIQRKRIEISQSLSCLLFPLLVFFYDLNYNKKFQMIKSNIINGVTVNFFIEFAKKYEKYEYIENIIPTVSFFIFSLISDGFEQTVGNYLRTKVNIFSFKRNKAFLNNYAKKD